MPNIETPEAFAEILSACGSCEEAARLITARDAAIRAESAELLRVCGEALTSANKQTQGVNAKVRTALAALKKAGVRVNETLKNEQEKNDA